MKRINKKNINTPDLSYEIFKERWREQVHYIDWKRFELLGKYFRGGKYLDIGCFNSPYLYELKRDFPSSEIYGIDYAQKVIEKMKKIFPEVNYMVIDFVKDDLPFENEFFDYVVIGEVLEHLEKPELLLNKAKRVLKTGGIIAISTPYSENIHEPPVSSEHLWGFVIDDFKKFLKNFGRFEIVLYQSSIKHLIGWAIKQNK